MKKSYLLFFVAILLAATTSCQKSPNFFSYSGITQGTYYQISYYANDSIVKHAEIEEFLQDFLKTASLWDQNSTISRINRNDETVDLSHDFIMIFNKSQEISKVTEGAFDITVGDLVNAWGFGFKSGENIDKHLIDSLLRYVGYQNIDIVNNHVLKQFPETKIDFNAIAKGYSVDLMTEFLRRKGIKNFIIDIGGEVYASGLKPDGSKWNIGIERPAENSESDRQVQNVISLTNKAVATSGTYRKYREIDSVRYSHTIDPRTGYPVSHTLLSATVIAENCTVADALATAFMVMGTEKAINFLKENPQFEAYFIFSNPEGKNQIICTEGFKEFLH